MQKVLTIVYNRASRIENGSFEHIELKPYFDGGFKVINISTSTAVVGNDIILYVTYVLSHD